MKLRELLNSEKFEVICTGKNPDQEITVPYCCDLLSVAMGNAPAGCAWCTVMGNMNTLAVASLTEAGCVILCGGTAIDDNMKLKAELEDIPLLRTGQPIFETALWVYEQIHAKNQL